MLNYIPGFRNNSPINKIIATIYYSICIYFILSFDSILIALTLFTAPFAIFRIINYYKIKTEKQKKIYNLLLIIFVISLIWPFDTLSDREYRKEIRALEQKIEEVKLDNEKLTKENKTIVEEIKDSKEYKEKLNQIESEKDKFRKENLSLEEELLKLKKKVK